MRKMVLDALETALGLQAELWRGIEELREGNDVATAALYEAWYARRGRAAKFRAYLVAQMGVCEWMLLGGMQDDDTVMGVWFTDCEHETWLCRDFVFCPYCGRRIRNVGDSQQVPTKCNKEVE